MFEKLIASTDKRSNRSGATLFASFLAHSAVLLALLALPLIHYQQLPEGRLLTFLGAAPPKVPPPPVPPAPAEKSQRPARPNQEVVRQTGFQVPAEIPVGVPDPPEDLPETEFEWQGDGGGVPGGQPGRLGEGFVGGELAAVAALPAPPPPPPPVKREPVRVGGEVQSSRLIRRVDPVYPPLAIKARVEGSVLLRATIDETGRIAQIEVVNGHPMLRQAALEAVRQWIYSPTLLNGEPVPVTTEISVNFHLTR